MYLCLTITKKQWLRWRMGLFSIWNDEKLSDDGSACHWFCLLHQGTNALWQGIHPAEDLLMPLSIVGLLDCSMQLLTHHVLKVPFQRFDSQHEAQLEPWWIEFVSVHPHMLTTSLSLQSFNSLIVDSHIAWQLLETDNHRLTNHRWLVWWCKWICPNCLI